MRSTRVPLCTARQIVDLLGESTLAPVKPTIPSKIRTVQIVCATRERSAVEPHLSRVGNAIVIGGLCTIFFAAAWAKLFPELAARDKLVN